MLGAADPLPRAPRRVLVAGTSGAGKTTLAARVGVALDLPHIEIDALHHGPGWERRSDFEADVAAFAATEGWVTEWQYSEVRGLLLERCDLAIVIGTSGVVQPAASLPFVALGAGASVVEVNPEPSELTPAMTHHVRGRVGEVLPALLG